MAKVKLLANAKVQGQRYKAGDEVEVKKKELVDELVERGLAEAPTTSKTDKGQTADNKQGD